MNFSLTKIKKIWNVLKIARLTKKEIWLLKMMEFSDAETPNSTESICYDELVTSFNLDAL